MDDTKIPSASRVSDSSVFRICADDATHTLLGDLVLGIVLHHLVLRNRPAHRELGIRLRLLNDYAVLPFPGQLGSVDLRVRSVVHGHLERATILLRYVFAVQRSR